MFFAPVVPFGELGNDGHPERGGFLPPVDLPRRMWAGGRLEFFRQIEVGNKIRRVSSIKDIVAKKGRTGEMVFVTVAHQILDDHGVLINEEQDIVYRELVPPDASTPSYKTSDESSDFSAEIFPNPVTLFRYSALTFNGHRIHYDRKYCFEEEGYPGLVFHGPLTATYLAQLLVAQVESVELTGFSFRAIKPLFDNHAFTVHGREQESGVYNLWATDYLGHIAMEARATCKR
jgi:3-methylfumaryl-CoA hydratase